MEAKEENRKGPQEMEEALAVGQINSCPPTTPRYPKAGQSFQTQRRAS